jgi:hypothetical protein
MMGYGNAEDARSVFGAGEFSPDDFGLVIALKNRLDA